MRVWRFLGPTRALCTWVSMRPAMSSMLAMVIPFSQLALQRLCVAHARLACSELCCVVASSALASLGRRSSAARALLARRSRDLSPLERRSSAALAPPGAFSELTFPPGRLVSALPQL